MNEFDTLFQPARSLVEQGRLLDTRHTSPAQPDIWQYLVDIRQAKHHAWHADETLVEVWTDLREKHAAMLPDLVGAYEHWSTHDYDVLEDYLTSKGHPELIADVEADLFHGCVNHHFKVGDALWETIMAAYAAGYWPCGWGKAAFPQGNLLVWRPTPT
ncbi:hypothetical protein [Chitinivorax sp. B]|uniref:hypothetical protein n=1 Tax=Chitinivorax sp. B TaxID=2502235 RepID=UPI0010F44B57|nr:hypothetical protein [Chitinivorax sp. B]